MESTIDIDRLKTWIGREQTSVDLVAPGPAEGLARLLGRQVDVGESSVVPPLWHWLYALPRPGSADLGPDGHPRTGGFLPPSPLPRRMWAGSDVVFHRPLRIGDRVWRRSRVQDVQLKTGRTGPLLFVTIDHEIASSNARLIQETQHLVYRSGPDGPAAERTPEKREDHARSLDALALFRFSALTYNSHRIHFDRTYARETEGYPDLVVQGPLQALVLMNHLLDVAEPRDLARYSFSARSPLFVDGAFIIEMNGQDEIALRIIGGAGQVCVEAKATLK